MRTMTDDEGKAIRRAALEGARLARDRVRFDEDEMQELELGVLVSKVKPQYRPSARGLLRRRILNERARSAEVETVPLPSSLSVSGLDPDMRMILAEAWRTLTPRERFVLGHRHVLDELYWEIAGRLRVSCERVRQIEKKALRQLRARMYNRGQRKEEAP